MFNLAVLSLDIFSRLKGFDKFLTYEIFASYHIPSDTIYDRNSATHVRGHLASLRSLGGKSTTSYRTGSPTITARKLATHLPLAAAHRLLLANRLVAFSLLVVSRRAAILTLSLSLFFPDKGVPTVEQ